MEDAYWAGRPNGEYEMAATSGDTGDQGKSGMVSVELPGDTVRRALGVLSQQGVQLKDGVEASLTELVDKSIQLYEALWRMQSDGASFYVDNIRAPTVEPEVQAQRKVFQKRAETNRRVLLPFKVR
jgi:hypothetical protein